MSQISGRIEKNRGLHGDERGTIALIVTAFIAIVFGVAALAIDGGNLYVLRNRMQAAADAAALAGASQLPTVANVNNAAQSWALKNLPAAEGNGNILSTSDIVIGNWNTLTRVFTAGATPRDSVKVTVRRTAATGNSVPTYFAGLIGIPTVNVVAEAIATGQDPNAPNCDNSGIISNQRIHLQSNNDLIDGVCIYGRQGVGIQSNNRFEVGTGVGMLNLNTFSQGSNNDIPPGTLQAYDLTASLSGQAASIVQGLREGVKMPPYITNTVTVSSLPENIIPGTAYIVNGAAAVKQGNYMNQVLQNVMHDIVIISTHNIDIPSNVHLENVILAANGKISLASNFRVGALDYCTTGRGAVQIVTPDNLDIASNRDIHGGQFIVGGLTNIASNDYNVALSVHSGGDVFLQSNEDIAGCGRNEHVWFGGSVGPKLRLVN
jgi:Flp pilus assembly protein TadG